MKTDTLVWLSSCALLGLSITQPANAALVFQESFEGSGQYSVENGGQQGQDNFFAVTDGTLDLGYSPSGGDGAHYFGGRDLNGFGSAAPHRLTFDPVDLGGYTDITLALSLSAVERPIYESGDKITLEYSSNGGTTFLTLDQFSGASGGALLSNGMQTLGETFTDISYLIPDPIDTLIFRIQADTFLASNEAVAFDNFRIEGTLASVPAPATGLLVALGLVALGYRPRQRTSSPRR